MTEQEQREQYRKDREAVRQQWQDHDRYDGVPAPIFDFRCWLAGYNAAKRATAGGTGYYCG